MNLGSEDSAIHVWRPAILPGLEMMRGVAVMSDQDQPKHTQPEYEICSLEQGTGELFCGGARHTHGPGCLAVILPDQVHAGRGTSSGGLTLRMATLTAFLIQNMASEPSAATPMLAAGVLEDAALARRFLRLHRCIEAQALTRLEAETRLIVFCSLLLRRHRGWSVPVPRRMERNTTVRVCDYLEEHYWENVSLHDLAEIAGLSTYHFHRAFQQEKGLPPHTFLRQIRLRRAKEMLARGLPAGRVAVEVGFFDQTHFNRHFKRLVGVTPARYAQNRNAVLVPPAPPVPYSSVST